MFYLTLNINILLDTIHIIFGECNMAGVSSPRVWHIGNEYCIHSVFSQFVHGIVHVNSFCALISTWLKASQYS